MSRYFVRMTGFALITAWVGWSPAVMGQDGPLKKRTVDITSTFKPVLRESAKINFAATPPTADTAKPVLEYAIPNQNLLFAYQPGSLKPLALSIDTGGRWSNSSYVKAGFGSLRTPFLQTGISFGDGRNVGLNINARHIASEGKREFQKFTDTRVALDGFYKNAKNMEWNAGIGMKQDQTYKYGFRPESLNFPKDSVRQRFQTFSGRLSFHNIAETEFGLSYSPEVRIDVFNDNRKNNESNTYVNLPLEKTFGDNFAVKVGVTFDLTRYSPDAKDPINNTMYYISPSLLYKTSNLKIQAGVRPSWDNKTFKMFPNLMAEVNTDDQKFTFQAGWIGYIRKTSYQYLASINPWLWAPNSLQNTWIEERYAGIRGSLGDHFSYSAKAGFNKYNNQPLFINDANDGKSFEVVNESQMKALHIGGELGYTVQEKFSLITGLTFYQYTNLKDNEKAFGLIPLELRAAMRLQLLKDLYLTSDLFAWSGPRYMRKDRNDDKLKGAVDLNAGFEFRITRNLKAWAQFNNLFNKEYELWSQYNTYGFNFVGGIIFNFDQKN